MRPRTSEYPLCRHIKTDGLLCQSPSVGASAFCHFHQRRRTRISSLSTGPALSRHVLHPLRNAESIQQALAMVIAGLAGGQVRPSHAGKMLFALQMAMTNLHQAPEESGF